MEEQTTPLAPGAQQAWAEPRRAAAAEPHKRLAVAAGTAVGDIVGAGEKQARPRSRTTRRRGTAGVLSGAGRAAHGGGSDAPYARG